jgi:6-phospho-3-hexuloisomerase
VSRVKRFEQAVDFLVDDVRRTTREVDVDDLDVLLDQLEAARHVVIFGRGRSGHVAQSFATRLAHLGFKSYVVGETSTPPVSDEDVVLLVSGSGETFSVTLTGRIARDVDATVVSVTATPDSALAEDSDHVVHLPVGEATPMSGELAPLGTRFELAAHAVFDGLVAELMERLGEDESSMQDRHATLE